MHAFWSGVPRLESTYPSYSTHHADLVIPFVRKLLFLHLLVSLGRDEEESNVDTPSQDGGGHGLRLGTSHSMMHPIHLIDCLGINRMCVCTRVVVIHQT